jgi:hypothetical protein
LTSASASNFDSLTDRSRVHWSSAVCDIDSCIGLLSGSIHTRARVHLSPPLNCRLASIAMRSSGGATDRSSLQRSPSPGVSRSLTSNSSRAWTPVAAPTSSSTLRTVLSVHGTRSPDSSAQVHFHCEGLSPSSHAILALFVCRSACAQLPATVGSSPAPPSSTARDRFVYLGQTQPNAFVALQRSDVEGHFRIEDCPVASPSPAPDDAEWDPSAEPMSPVPVGVMRVKLSVYATGGSSATMLRPQDLLGTAIIDLESILNARPAFGDFATPDSGPLRYELTETKQFLPPAPTPARSALSLATDHSPPTNTAISMMQKSARGMQPLTPLQPARSPSASPTRPSASLAPAQYHRGETSPMPTLPPMPFSPPSARTSSALRHKQGTRTAPTGGSGAAGSSAPGERPHRSHRTRTGGTRSSKPIDDPAGAPHASAAASTGGKYDLGASKSSTLSAHRAAEGRMCSSAECVIS